MDGPETKTPTPNEPPEQAVDPDPPLPMRAFAYVVPVPAERLVSWPAIGAWAVAPFSLVPLVGLPAAIVLLVLGVWLRTRPRYPWDAKTGTAAIAIACIAIATGAVAVVSVILQGRLPQFPEHVAADIPIATRALQIVALIMAVVLHECGHALAAAWAGDLTAVKRNRLSLNPLRHVDLVGSIVLPGILIATGASSVFGWAKPVPVVPQLFRKRRWGNLGVSVAGVGVNLLLAMACLSALVLVGSVLNLLVPGLEARGFWLPVAPTHLGGFPGAVGVALVADLLKAGVLINLVLMAFNLLPIPPLDGSHVVETLLPASVARHWAQIRRGGFLILIVCIATGVVDRVLNVVAIAAVFLCYAAGAICGLG